MNKKTQMILGVFAVGAVAYWLLNRRKDKIFANYTATTLGGGFGGAKTPVGCKVYEGTVSAPIGTILSSWVHGDGKRGIIVNKSSNSFTICPEGQTSIMPIKF